MTTKPLATLPDYIAGGIVLVFEIVHVAMPGFWFGAEITPVGAELSGWQIQALLVQLLMVLGTALAVTAARHLPHVALGATVVVGLLQVLFYSDVLLSQVTTMYVAFACGRWGGKRTQLISAIGIPCAAVVAWIHLKYQLRDDLTLTDAVWASIKDIPTGIWIVPLVAVIAMLAIPWAIGFALRSLASAKESRLALQKADEIAELHSAQAQLARDVHDVVGHSLSVILAQAQSARYLQTEHEVDPRIIQTFDNIAATARKALQDVRHVLTSTAPGPSGNFIQLVEGVRSTGVDVTVGETGTARPLPPELETVAYRVMQEMLTNALKHGKTGGSITVNVEWSEGLILTVTNWLADDSDSTPAQGMGIHGMHRRLQSIGGSLKNGVFEGEAGKVYSVQAQLPIRRGA